MKLKLIVAAGATAALLAACADGYGRGYGYGPGYGYGYGPVAYDGYYDGYYGPIYDGYWRGGYFYWRDRDDHPFRRDNDRHVRRQAAQGFQPIHGQRHLRRLPPDRR